MDGPHPIHHREHQNLDNEANRISVVYDYIDGEKDVTMSHPKDLPVENTEVPGPKNGLLEEGHEVLEFIFLFCNTLNSLR